MLRSAKTDSRVVMSVLGIERWISDPWIAMSNVTVKTKDCPTSMHKVEKTVVQLEFWYRLWICQLGSLRYQFRSHQAETLYIGKRVSFVRYRCLFFSKLIHITYYATLCRVVMRRVSYHMPSIFRY